MLKSLDTVNYCPISSGKSYSDEFDGQNCWISSEVRNVLNLLVELRPSEAFLKIDGFYENDTPLMVAIEYLLGHFHEVQKLTIQREAGLGSLSRLAHFEIEK